MATFESSVQLHQHAERQFGPEWVTFVAYAKDIGIVAGAATSMIKLAKEIIDWRRRHRSKGAGKKANVILQRAGRPSLKLSEADDSEITRWFEK